MGGERWEACRNWLRQFQIKALPLISPVRWRRYAVMRGSSENRLLPKIVVTYSNRCGAGGTGLQALWFSASKLSAQLLKRRGWLGYISLNNRSGERNSSFLNLRSDPHPVHRRLASASLSLLCASNQVAFHLYSPALASTYIFIVRWRGRQPPKGRLVRAGPVLPSPSSPGFPGRR